MGNYTTSVTTGRMVAHNMVTTQFELDGFRVVRTLGVVRGITVRSRSIFGTIGAGLQTIVGGNITLLTNLCERTRAEAFDLMLVHAAEIGGNAVVGARYDATEVMQGVTEVLAYGTAVFVRALTRYRFSDEDYEKGGGLSHSSWRRSWNGNRPRSARPTAENRASPARTNRKHAFGYPQCT
jgi:uncharacterized protein YbjQ (UPF0145 family)